MWGIGTFSITNGVHNGADLEHETTCENPSVARSPSEPSFWGWMHGYDAQLDRRRIEEDLDSLEPQNWATIVFWETHHVTMHAWWKGRYSFHGADNKERETRPLQWNGGSEHLDLDNDQQTRYMSIAMIDVELLCPVSKLLKGWDYWRICALSEVERKQRTTYTASALLSPISSSLIFLLVRSRDKEHLEEISSMP